MRSLGWILGGLYALDGLVALLRGEQVMQWADRSLAPKLPARWARMVKQSKPLEPALIRAWGVNNLLAGLGMLLVATSMRSRMRRA
jgi:hypothetical protein